MRVKIRINKRDALASGLLCLLGLVAAFQVSAGSAARISALSPAALPVMPVVLGALLMFIGVLGLFKSQLSPDDDEGMEIGASKWRGTCGVSTGLFIFLLLVRYAGVAPAVLTSVFVIAMGDHHHTWRSAGVLAVLATSLALAITSFVLPALG